MNLPIGYFLFWCSCDSLRIARAVWCLFGVGNAKACCVANVEDVVCSGCGDCSTVASLDASDKVSIAEISFDISMACASIQ